MSGGRGNSNSKGESQSQSQSESPATPPRLLPPHEDFPADTQQLATPSVPLPFDSPGLYPQPPPPGASQPNAPLHPPSSPVSSHLQSPNSSKRAQQKFSLLRKKGNKGTPSSSSTPPVASSSPIDDDDDAWLLEGTSSNGHVNATVSVGKEASNLSRSVDTLSLADSDVGDSPSVSAYAAPTGLAPASAGRVDKRLSKPRALAKKTSRLFSRNGHHQEDTTTSASLVLPGASTVRQNSVSSTLSCDSRHKQRNLSRVSSSTSSPPSRGTPDSSQPFSWHPPSSFALRRTTSQTTAGTDVMPSFTGAPDVHKRESNSHLTPSGLTHRNDSSSASIISQHSHHHATSSQSQSHSSFQTHSQSHSQTSLPKQDANLPGRMTSWFSNLLPSNNNPDQSPSSLSEPANLPPSPLRKPTGVAASFFSAARNKAVGGMRYLLDSEAQPDHCQDTMWVMGVPHPGYHPGSDDSLPSGESGPSSSPSWTSRFKEGSGTYSSSPPARGGLGNFFGSGFSLAGQAGEPSTPPSDASRRKDKQKEAPKWPEQFYDDFRSRVWCTYRSQYAPILSLPPGQLLPTPESYYGAFAAQPESQLPQPGQTSIGAGQSSSSRLSNGPWGWVKGDERGLTSDAGWGCMLRTGQSVLANALIHLHLGRGWRLPSQKPSTTPESPLELAELEAYATYVRILSWFLDDPSPLCPFSVHRMALIGKELGKEVGEWFGPSTASGALKTLVNSFPLCGLSVVNAVDGIIYRSDVFTASNMSSDEWTLSSDSPRRSRPSSMHRSGWGGRPVLILINLRLGLDGVNPIYYDSVKTLFTFPQSVGIAGGRPSSSYYFVASQANSLFYLDPHFTRQAVPLRVPPPNVAQSPRRRPASIFTRDSMSVEEEEEQELVEAESAPTSAVSQGSDSSSLRTADVVNLDHDGPDIPTSSSPIPELQSPSKPRRRLTLTQALRIKSTGTPPRKSSAPPSPTTPTLKGLPRRTSHGSPSPSRPMPTRHSTASSTSSLRSRVLPVDPQTAWYASAYSEANLKTFHCDKVKKLPLSGLDPSMLLGFLCQSEAEFDDFCERVAALPQKIFAVQEEPPLWSEDDDGLESVSERLSDYDSEASSHNDEPDLELDDLDEFGQMPTTARPPGPQRDDTIRPLTTATASLGRGSSADEHDEFSDDEADTTAGHTEADQTLRTRKSSVVSTSSQRRIRRASGDRSIAESTSTLAAAPARLNQLNTDVLLDSDTELVPTPTASDHPAESSTQRPRRPRGAPQDATEFIDEEEMLVPPSRVESLSAKTSIASLRAANNPGGAQSDATESAEPDRADPAVDKPLPPNPEDQDPNP